LEVGLAKKEQDIPIFPDLRSQAELPQKINLLERGWLDGAELAFPANGQFMARNFTFFRLAGTKATFHLQQNHLKARGIASNMLTALHYQFLPCIYVIQHTKGCVEILMGTHSKGISVLESLLESNLGLELITKREASLSFAADPYPYGAVLTGIPHMVEKKNAQSLEGNEEGSTIDLLLSGLPHEEWTYIVQALPVQRKNAVQWLEACAQEIREIKQNLMLTDVQKSNRLAAYYVEILEQTLKRLHLGRQQGLWQTGVYLLAPERETALRGAALLSSIFAGERSRPDPIRCHVCKEEGDISPLINCYWSKELGAFISLPRREYSGYRLQEEVLFDVDFHEEKGKSLSVGKILSDRGAGDHICSVPVDDLTKHGLIAGVTGSGKTNTIFHLLFHLFQEHHIPFLVIEPAKAEYRHLLNRIKDLHIFTLGEERPGLSAPFRLNPFAFPEGVALQSHLDYLKAVFNASFVMYAPMPYVLEECLYRIYEDKGWNLVTSENFRGPSESAFPTLSDLYGKIDEVVENIGYQDRTTMDIKAALKTRIKNLCLGGKGLMLNTGPSVPFAEIMERPCVMELKYMGNDEEKTFLMGLILMRLSEHYESSMGNRRQEEQRGLKHLTVIEEAHRLLKNIPTEKSAEEQSNVKGKGVETFCNMLSEIRAYGEGVLVSEQIPTKLAPDVIKNSNLKIMHRIVSRDDRDCLGDAMNLDDHQKRHAASLDTGEAIFFREGIDRSLLLKVPVTKEKSEPPRVANEDLYRHMSKTYFSIHPSLLELFPGCSRCVAAKDRHQCERLKKRSDEIMDMIDGERAIVKCFLPYLLNPERGRVWEHLSSLLPLDDETRYCLCVHLTSRYIRKKGDGMKWPFAWIEELTAKVQADIASGGFIAVLGRYMKERATAGRVKFPTCAPYCRQICLFGYEGGFLERDAVLHNRFCNVLNGHEQGKPFFQMLESNLRQSLQDYIPSDLHPFLGDVMICLLIHKLNRLGFTPTLQKDIMGGIAEVLQRSEDARR